MKGIDNIQNSEDNERYTTNLTVAGTTFNAILDTGSTDIWFFANNGLADTFQDTKVPIELQFGSGATVINGTIGIGNVTVAGTTFPNQAFVVSSEAQASADITVECDSASVCGLVGLGFDSPQSAVIPATLTAAGQDGSTEGKSLLSNIFDSSPDKERIFGLSLSRAGDRRESAEARLDIGEVDAQHQDVLTAPVLPSDPQGCSTLEYSVRWHLRQRLVTLIDSGTTNISPPIEVVNAVYSSIPGAVLAKNATQLIIHESATLDTWVVPCGTAIRVTAKFGGQSFHLHPLDITDLSVQLGPDGKNYTVCAASMTALDQGILDVGVLDAIFGDSFMRNVYSLFGFGNDTTPPYMQFLSQTDKHAASDFAGVRRKLLRDGPPELDPQAFVELFGFTGASSISGSESVSSKLSDDLASVSSPSSSSSSDPLLRTYGPLIIGLLGANLLLVLILVVVGIMLLVKRRGLSRKGAYCSS
ncbi:aspartic peptidase domain-containing protein [Mycena amicta]|nr:aspartic peptidase domain-containing protein [Mycena amicta]